MTEGVGHNSVAADELRLLIERWERLNEEKKAIADDQKDVMLEAKSRGYDVKQVRAVIRVRAMDEQRRREEQAIFETYMHALGLL